MTAPETLLDELFRENHIPMSDRNAVIYDALRERLSASEATGGKVVKIEMCPRPINGADCESAAWCVLSGNCGCDHGMKILLRPARGIDAAFSDDAQQRRDAWKRVDELEAECSRLRNDLSEAIFQRDLARTDANEEARCADELNKQLNVAAREVKALRATTIRNALIECRETAMRYALEARIPECGHFGSIAQDLDYVCSAMFAATPPPRDAGREAQEASRYRWLRKLKSGRPESQIALARVILALREKPEAMDVFIDEQIATDRAALATEKGR